MSTGHNLNHENPRGRLVAGFVRLLERLRLSLLGALEKESRLAAEKAEREDDKDLFDRLPDQPHLDYGDVKHYDGKLRYFDE